MFNGLIALEEAAAGNAAAAAADGAAGGWVGGGGGGGLQNITGRRSGQPEKVGELS